jgi:hypothetical protein
MRPRRLIVALIAVVVGTTALVAITVFGWGPDVDRKRYVAKNVALLRSLPRFPYAEVVGVVSAPYRTSEAPGARIAGYGTTRTYRLPPSTEAREVIAFYRRALVPAWTPVAESPDDYISLRRGDAYVHILVGATDVVVELDHDCYKLFGAMACFGP